MTIRLFWWGGNRKINFGDGIAAPLVHMMSGRPVEYADISRCDMAATGSILQKLTSKKWKRIINGRFNKIIVWGSGAFSPHGYEGGKGLSVYCIRGKLTAEAVKLSKHVATGDPGLLVDRWDYKMKKQYRWGIIPHISDRSSKVISDMNKNNSNSCIIDLADPDFSTTIKKIMSCDFIISSSLHGLIAADSFGIPNTWMEVNKGISGGHWKFMDYFSSIDRKDQVPLSAMEHEIDLLALEKDAKPSNEILIAQQKRNLEESFKKIGF